MASRTYTLKQEKIEAVVALVRDRLDGAKATTAERFVRQFYVNVAPQDLVQEEAEDLFGAAIAMWGFGRERDAQTPKIRAYNPSFEEVGWQSAHTVLEIVNDDMPFLVDSVTSALNQQDLTVHLVIHPIMRVTRTPKGTVKDLLDSDADGGDGTLSESFMHLKISEQKDPKVLADIEEIIAGVLRDVRYSVEDWRTMRKAMVDVIAGIEKAPPAAANGDVDEVLAFLRWIEDNHFTFLGYRVSTMSVRVRNRKCKWSPPPGSAFCETPRSVCSAACGNWVSCPRTSANSCWLPAC